MNESAISGLKNSIDNDISNINQNINDLDNELSGIDRSLNEQVAFYDPDAFGVRVNYAQTLDFEISSSFTGYIHIYGHHAGYVKVFLGDTRAFEDACLSFDNRTDRVMYMYLSRLGKSFTITSAPNDGKRTSPKIYRVTYQTL